MVLTNILHDYFTRLLKDITKYHVQFKICMQLTVTIPVKITGELNDII